MHVKDIKQVERARKLFCQRLVILVFTSMLLMDCGFKEWGWYCCEVVDNDFNLRLCPFSLQVELLSHFGSEHFCPLSLIR